MLIVTDSGVGGAGSAGAGVVGSGVGGGGGGSSSGRNGPPAPPGTAIGFTADGDEGAPPPLQLHIVNAPAVTKAEYAILIRTRIRQAIQAPG